MTATISNAKSEISSVGNTNLRTSRRHAVVGELMPPFHPNCNDLEQDKNFKNKKKVGEKEKSQPARSSRSTSGKDGENMKTKEKSSRSHPWRLKSLIQQVSQTGRH